ncbi:hypothetical protein HDV00_000716 [Rhizophlyctis rosea]|nr:hypothetical protein HDV00_000716 [Rhizophlyctis rosea]
MSLSTGTATTTPTPVIPTILPTRSLTTPSSPPNPSSPPSSSTPPNLKALPAPTDAATQIQPNADGVHDLTDSFYDQLGPLVVNEDGSLSRISNWPEMSEIERKNVLRVLGKRNKMRIERLKKEMGESGEEKKDEL